MRRRIECLRLGPSIRWPHQVAAVNEPRDEIVSSELSPGSIRCDRVLSGFDWTGGHEPTETARKQPKQESHRPSIPFRELCFARSSRQRYTDPSARYSLSAPCALQNPNLTRPPHLDPRSPQVSELLLAAYSKTALHGRTPVGPMGARHIRPNPGRKPLSELRRAASSLFSWHFQ